jgi:hypothetical protein
MTGLGWRDWIIIPAANRHRYEQQQTDLQTKLKDEYFGSLSLEQRHYLNF